MTARGAIRTPLALLLAGRIRARGPITFAEYMRECLYHQDYGYYNRPERSRFADFYTSVDVHPIFARLLARQLAEMWELLGQPDPFLAVEVGAGTGRLAQHFLGFAARELPEFYRALCYMAAEHSPARSAAHREHLAAHLAAGRAASLAALPGEIAAGCVFSNELLDAMPVHRVALQQGVLRECYVALAGEEFCEQWDAPSTPRLAAHLREQGIELREGQQGEVCLDACEWIESVGKRLGRGFVLTVDYGHEAHELYDERHMRGTLLAYSRHRASEEFFSAPGEHDLTAHVNFTALDLCGRRAGLSPAGLVSQGRFLLALGRGNEFADLYEEGQNDAERLRARLLLKSLLFPEGMGETFQVFIQHKGVERPALTGLQPF